MTRDELDVDVNGPTRVRNALDDKELVVSRDGCVLLDDRVAISVDVDAFATEDDKTLKKWVAELRLSSPKRAR